MRRARLLPLLGFAVLYGGLQVAVPWRHLAATPGDFGRYYHAAAALLAGESPFSLHNFDYPPLLAFLVAPLALLPFEAARGVWFLLGQLCLLAAAWHTWRWLGGHRPGGDAALVAVAGVWCLMGTVAENLVLGQINPLLLVVLTVALRRGRERPPLAGALIGAAAALKLWPAALLAVFALRRRWGGLAAGAVTAAVLLLLPGLLLRVFWPPPHLPASSGYWRGTPAPLNVSLPAVALRLADPPAAGGRLPESWLRGDNPRQLELPPGRGALSVVVSVGGFALGLLLVAPALRVRGGAGSRLALPVLLALCLLTGTLSWYHYQLLQLPALAALAAARLRRRAWGGLAVVTLVGLGLTRSQHLFALYVAAHGWTAGAPVLLWGITSLVPVLGVAWLVLLVRDA